MDQTLKNTPSHISSLAQLPHDQTHVCTIAPIFHNGILQVVRDVLRVCTFYVAAAVSTLELVICSLVWPHTCIGVHLRLRGRACKFIKLTPWSVCRKVALAPCVYITCKSMIYPTCERTRASVHTDWLDLPSWPSLVLKTVATLPGRFRPFLLFSPKNHRLTVFNKY